MWVPDIVAKVDIIKASPFGISGKSYEGICSRAKTCTINTCMVFSQLLAAGTFSLTLQDLINHDILIAFETEDMAG